MSHFLLLTRPQNIFCRVCEISAGEIGGRIGLYPGDAVENLEIQLSQAAGNGEDVVICSAYPDGTIGFQMLTAGCQPCFIKFVVLLKSLGLIPLAFVHRHGNAALYADAAVG